MKAYIYNDDKGDDISIEEIPEAMKDDAELYHTELVEKICELDDELMMMYLEGEEPSIDELKKVLRKATCECTAVPVCCGTAYKNKGVQKLLDAVIEFMPSPLDVPAIQGVDMDGNDTVRHSSDEEPFSALVFKIMSDPFVGKLAYFRVYSGTVNSGSYVLNATKGKKSVLDVSFRCMPTNVKSWIKYTREISLLRSDLSSPQQEIRSVTSRIR